MDEISLAKPKVIGMDMYFPDPQRDEFEQPEQGPGQEQARRDGIGGVKPAYASAASL
jgi:hypothetical protein